jgi:hypothetical protein
MSPLPSVKSPLGDSEYLTGIPDRSRSTLDSMSLISRESRKDIKSPLAIPIEHLLGVPDSIPLYARKYRHGAWREPERFESTLTVLSENLTGSPRFHPL